MIVYRVPSEDVRIGIVVTTKSGNAVVRNTIRRRTRAVARELCDAGTMYGEIVIRFRPESGVPHFSDIKEELVSIFSGAVNHTGRNVTP